MVRSESWRVERRDRKATILSDVAVCEGGRGLLDGVEVVRSESWLVERESWRVARGAEV